MQKYRGRISVLLAAMAAALLSTSVIAGDTVTYSQALADIQAVNAQDGAALQKQIQAINQTYGTAQTFSSSAMNAGRQVGDAAAQAAGNQYDTATQDSMAGAAKHRQGNEAQDVAPAAHAAGNSLSGPIASHTAQGHTYEQDANNAENYVCTATNKKGQCTAGYWNCNGTCQEYRALAQQQFHLAAEDQGQQSALYGQSSQLHSQGSQQLQQHVTLDNAAQANENGAYNTNLQGSEQAGELEQQGQAQIVQQAKTDTDRELANIRKSLFVPNEDLPYTLPDIPAQSANTLTASVQSQVNRLQVQATQLADTAMSESQAAAEAYRQEQAYLQAEAQAKQQAQQDEANAASAPTPSSRAAWASAAAVMRAKAANDAAQAQQQKSVYEQQKQLAEQHTQQSEQLAMQETQIAKGAVESKASQQIVPYLH